VLPGGKVAYRIEFTNDGGVAYTIAKPASIDDPLGSVLDDAAYGGDADATVGDVALASGALHWEGPLGIGDTAIITYTATVDQPDEGNAILDNNVTTPPSIPSNCSEIPADPADPDSLPSQSTDPDCSTQTLVKRYVALKTVHANGTVRPGDTVTYTVLVTNTGQVDYTALEPAEFTDDFSGVLDDATYLGDASGDGASSYADPTLSWSGPLPVGGSATVTYSFRINPAGGDDHLRNAVLPTLPGGQCDPTVADPCDTNVTIVRPLAPTGLDAVAPFGAGALLLALGWVLLWIAGRRRGRRA
jgi:uncharacterized repeat protein (TIGR01451 family)